MAARDEMLTIAWTKQDTAGASRCWCPSPVSVWGSGKGAGVGKCGLERKSIAHHIAWRGCS